MGIQAYFEQTEYGSARPGNTTNPSRYAWLGIAQRFFDALAVLALNRRSPPSSSAHP
jgi:hypothetical protein